MSNAEHTVLDFTGRKLSQPLSLEAARKLAAMLAWSRKELVTVAPAGRDAYPDGAGEAFYPPH